MIEESVVYTYGLGGIDGGASYQCALPIGANVVPTKKQLAEADRILREFDWSRYEAMSDEEIRTTWAWDPDMIWPTDEELKEFVLVNPPKRAKPPEAAEQGSASIAPRERIRFRGP